MHFAPIHQIHVYDIHQKQDLGFSQCGKECVYSHKYTMIRSPPPAPLPLEPPESISCTQEKNHQKQNKNNSNVKVGSTFHIAKVYSVCNSLNKQKPSRTFTCFAPTKKRKRKSDEQLKSFSLSTYVYLKNN